MGNKCAVAQSYVFGGSKGGVLCFGHPLLDMMAPVDEAFLTEYGIPSGSVNLAEPKQLPVFQRVSEELADVVDYVPGGSAMNTARALAWMRPELPVSYVGALGTDKFANILKLSLANAGVNALFEEHADKPTGTCACLVVDTERALVANLGAAVHLSRSFIDSPEVQQCIDDSVVYYAEGFFLNTASSPDGLLYVAKHAHATGKTFCFNLNAPYISHAFKERIDLLMPYISILFGSSEDVMAYAKVQWPKDFAELASPATTENHISSSTSESTDGTLRSPSPQVDEQETEAKARLHDAVARIANLPCSSGRRMVVVTCGSANTVVGQGNEVHEYPVPPMKKEDMVDVNGAGDAFVGGFLAQYTIVKDEETSTHVAHALAQNCIRHNGAVVGGPVPTLVYGNRAAKQKSPSRS